MSSWSNLTNRGRHRIALIVVAAGALMLVAQWLWGRTLWLDEEMIAINLRDRSVGELAGALSLGQAAPYGWLVAERAMLVGAGTGERALRFIPLLFGIATLATAAWIGRRWMTTAGATLLALLCATGQWLAFHALELKHYSADACFGLILPALAAWALDGGAGRAEIRRRVAVWWIVAAASQWFSNGALFVAPACATIVALFIWKRSGWRESVRAAVPGCLWLASFALNYRVTLGPALGSTFLRGYWASAFPPEDAGLAGTLRWLERQLTPLALKPGGSKFGLVFWGASAVGLVAAPGYPLAFRVLFASVPCSAFVWAAIRLVPLSDRLGLWFVPSLYVGIAMAGETGVALFGSGDGRRWMRAAAGAVTLAVLVAIAADTSARGTVAVALRSRVSNHDLDDRAAVAWLVRQRREGDVWMGSHLTLPAIWWYAGTEASTPAVEASFEPGSPECGDQDIGVWASASRSRRVLVYLGFGQDAEFGDALLGRLTALGSVTAYRPFQSGHALIVDLTQPAAGPATLASLALQPRPSAPSAAPGCVGVAAASRW